MNAVAEAQSSNQVESANPTQVPSTQRVLIVEDLEDTRNSLQQLLELSGFEADTASDGMEALEMLAQRTYSLLITDLRMPRLGGMKLIQEIQNRRIPVTVVVTTGHGSTKDAVEAMHMGAYDFLVKPVDPQQLSLLVRRALRERALQDEVAALRDRLQDRHSFQNVISKSPKMHDVFELIGHVSDTASTVLIIGETGTGKEQVARAVHQASSQHRPGTFVAVNCAALPETLLESELFGHEKGSFTGAAAQRKGRFEQAHLGTIFLDEVGDIPLAMQVKLLRVLQDRKFERIGGGDVIEVDVRVVAATHQNLEKLVREGKFREDLYYRLNVVRVELPSLRERPEDIPVLASHFVQKYSKPSGPPLQISPEAMQVLLSYAWPGNVRQLENAIERACITSRDGIILPVNLPPDISRNEANGRQPFQVDINRPLPDQVSELVRNFEERYLRRALKRTRGHVGKCARISGLSRRSVTEKISQFKIDRTMYKGE